MKNWQLRVTIVITALWVIVMPLLWPYWDADLTGCDCPDNFVPRYYADVAIGAVCIILLPGAWVRWRWAAVGLVAAAFLLPALKTLLGSSLITFYVPAWFVSSILLLVTAWGAYKFIPGTLPKPARASVRALMAVPYGLAAIGTLPAYLYLVAGTYAGFEGVANGAHLLGVAMSVLSLCALFGLWTLWSIGKRVWNNGAYVAAAHASGWRDGTGLLAGWIAFSGFVAIRKPVDRIDEIVVSSALLVPALVLATIAFSWALLTRATAPSARQERAPMGAIMRTVMKLEDLPGVISGVLVGLVALTAVPRPPSGWGPCPFSFLFPIAHRLWRTEHPIVFDACDTNPIYLAAFGFTLSTVCLIAGAIAAAAGRQTAARRGAVASAILLASALVPLTFDVIEFGWRPSLFIGLATVAAAAWFGYLGGLHAEKNRWRLWWKSPGISPSGSQ